MKCHYLFSVKIRKNISKCHLLKFLPRVPSVRMCISYKKICPCQSGYTCTSCLFSVSVYSIHLLLIIRDDGIKGLEGKELEFLGLLDCSDDPSHRRNLPARKVSTCL